MATNNYFGFTHGGTYNAQPGYAAVPTAAGNINAAYAARPGYDQAAYQAAATQGTYASTGAPAATYDYGYARAPQTYDTSKTYYQQAGATPGYNPQAYDAATAAKVVGYQQAATYAQPARTAATAAVLQAKPAQYNSQQTYVPQTTYSQTVTTVNTAPKQAATTNSTTYSNYDAALYSAATMYVAQQTNKTTNSGQGGNWNYNKKPGQNNSGPGQNPKPRPKPQPKLQQLHYCEVCKISCAGPQTYREHLEGQKHKKREASLKMTATVAATATQSRGNALHCELCDVTCTGNDAYAAHVRGSKHQKVVKLHQKLGKPIPSSDPAQNKKNISFVKAGSAATGVDSKESECENLESDLINSDDIKPVGVEYIEEMRDEDGKIISFNCKLCECKFNDPNAKEMHMKGRRHRLQYKKKVQPDLVVDIKPNPRQRKMAEAKAQRAQMQEEYWNRRRMQEGDLEEEDRVYWDERRRFEDEFDYMNWMQRGGYGARPHLGRPPGPPHCHPFFGMMPGRRPESSDDRHVVARHAEIYPKEEELQTIQRVVSHTERALKFVSDVLNDTGKPAVAVVNAKTNVVVKSEDKVNSSGDVKETKENNLDKVKEDGRDNQMFSFQKEAEGGNTRILKGVMRVGLLAKGLLLQGDNVVQLVVLCAEKPTSNLLKRVVDELPSQIKKISEEFNYKISMVTNDGAIFVTDGTITVKVSLTSPLLRAQDTNNATPTEQPVQSSDDLLPREPCLQALAALRHAKWFQARATGLQSCVMVMRILRDLCQRNPIWTPLNQWAMELIIEKVISSAGMPLSPGDCMRRVMEGVASGILINGPGILDPCEKDPHDAIQNLTKQQREDLTVSAQQFLRFIAFRQIHKVLGMDPLPPSKFQSRPWRFNRKRRRSGTEGTDAEGDGKMVKKDGDMSGSELKMDTELTK